MLRTELRMARQSATSVLPEMGSHAQPLAYVLRLQYGGPGALFNFKLVNFNLLSASRRSTEIRRPLMTYQMRYKNYDFCLNSMAVIYARRD